MNTIVKFKNDKITIMNRNKLLLSIIIPVYNVESYLRKCLNTCLKQNIENYEIICIDDGSTDYSGTILDEYERLAPFKIRVVHTTNNGVSHARNLGITLAIGDYIWFIDPDDYIQQDILFRISQILSGIDLLLLPYHEITDAGMISSVEHGPKSIDVVNRTDFSEYLANNTFNRVWKYIVKRSLITDNGLAFGEGIVVSEDRLFNFFFFFFIKNYSIFNETAYYYRLSNQSATRGRTASEKERRRLIDNKQEIIRYIISNMNNNCDFLKTNKEEIHACLYDYVRSLISSSIRCGDNKYLNEKLLFLKKNGLYPYPVHLSKSSNSMFKNMMSRLFNSPLIANIVCIVYGLIDDK